MRSVGRRKAALPQAKASGEALVEGARFNESLAALGGSTFIPRGLQRFRTQEDANRHWHDCIAKGIARLAPRMDQYSRPATLDDLKLLLRSLNAHGVKYLLVGGYALAAHGYQRATTDIDILVPAARESG